MYARHRLASAHGRSLPESGRFPDALRLRAGAPLPMGLAGLGALAVTADNSACRMELEARFDDVWSIRHDLVLTGSGCQLCWPAHGWQQVAALPGRPGQAVALHCLGTAPCGRLVLTPRGASSSLAMERLVCRHIHPLLWHPDEPPAPASPTPPRGDAVAPETLPSVFTLAWARQLPLNLEMPLASATLHCQDVPSAPVWRGSDCHLSLGERRLVLDCSRLSAVLRQRRRCRGGWREAVVLLGEEGEPVLRLCCDNDSEWRRLLGQVLYSPRGATLSK